MTLEFIKNIDMQVLLLIQQYTKSPFLDLIMPFITHLADIGFIWIAIDIFFLIRKKYRYIGIRLALALILCLVVGSLILKPLIARQRPFSFYDQVTLLIPTPLDFSFPSGHTMASFAAATIIFKYLHKTGIFAFILALLIAFSRLYLFVHFPSDVLAGLILGVFIAYISIWICNKSSKSDKHRKNV